MDEQRWAAAAAREAAMTGTGRRFRLPPAKTNALARGLSPAGGFRLPTVLFLLLSLMLAASGAVVERLPNQGSPAKLVALTFDACESRAPAWFDERILSFLLHEKIPCTLFLGGKFAERNAERVRALARFPFVEMENHSYSHFQHMERLGAGAIDEELVRADGVIRELTGRATRFFRFPGGNFDAAALAEVERLGYTVVHWAFASGDPDKHITASMLERGVLSRVKPGDILIFHVNGRGWSTADALPTIVAELRRRGFGFVRLDQAMGPSGAAGTAAVPEATPPPAARVEAAATTSARKSVSPVATPGKPLAAGEALPHASRAAAPKALAPQPPPPPPAPTRRTDPRAVATAVMIVLAAAIVILILKRKPPRGRRR